MTELEFYLFTSLLVLPTLYQRTKLLLNPSSFDKMTWLRRKTGLNLHHGHLGYVMMAISIILLVLGVHNWISIGLGGAGLSLSLDEIPPMFKMPSPGRYVEMSVYKGTTIVALLTVCLVFEVFSIAFELSSG